LNANTRICAHFSNCNVTLRDRHDDFADQVNAVGIGANAPTLGATVAPSMRLAHFSGRHFVF
jgi:hypothetical protein